MMVRAWSQSRWCSSRRRVRKRADWLLNEEGDVEGDVVHNVDDTGVRDGRGGGEVVDCASGCYGIEKARFGSHWCSEYLR
jgi:hypothetical protein